MYKKQIENYFERNRAQMLEDIRRLIAIRSVRGEASAGLPFGEGPAEALHAALAMASDMGFSVRNVDNYAGAIDLNGLEPALGILAHLDTVEEGEGWTRPPLEGAELDGKLYGRGSADDKGPAVAALYALAAAREIRPDMKKGARLILGCAEETGSECIAYYRKKEALPPHVFSPDACFPVINIEKGGFRPVFGAEWEACGDLPRVRSVTGGRTANIVPGRASAEVEGLELSEVRAACLRAEKEAGVAFSAAQDGEVVRISAEGVGAHASLPEKGNNAQTALIALLAALPMAPCRGFEMLKALSELFPHGDNGGKALGVAMSDELSGELTLTFSVLDFGLGGFTARFDSRTPLCADSGNVAGPVLEAFETRGIAVKAGRRMVPPHHTPGDGEFVKTLLDAYEKYTERPGGCIALGGGTYVHDIEGGVAFGCSMPGTENHVHGADEFAVVDELVKSAEIFTEVILNICG